MDKDISTLADSRPSEALPPAGTKVKVKWKDEERELEIGSADWRDYQSEEFDRLVDNPEEWEYKITAQQEQRVRTAHSEFVTHFKPRLPDSASIRTIISNQFELPKEKDEDGPTIDIKLMTKFWEEFVSDMPLALKAAGATHSLNMVWIDRKIKHVLEESKLSYNEWEEEELACNLKSPESMRAAADGLDQLEEQGFELYHLEEKDAIVRWNFRRGQEVTYEEQTS